MVKMPSKISDIVNIVLDICYPKKCVVCKIIFDYGSSESGICENCIKIFEKPVDNICQKCGRQTNDDLDICYICSKVIAGKLYNDKNIYFTKNYPLFIYNESTKLIIFDLKYSKKLYTLSGFEKIIENGLADIDLSNIDLIIPIAMYHRKELLRGFNQATLLAQIISKLTNIEYDNKTLVRTKNTKVQNKKSLKDRYESLEGCFSVVSKEKVLNKTILLIDDIYTSGSTINISSKELINSGAKEVYSITLSITEDRNRH